MLKKIGDFFVDILETIAVAVSLFVLIYFTAARPHKVDGESMLPTFQDHSFLLTDKLSYRFSEPERGDVVVFHFPKDERFDYIKRVIALPGEKIKLENNTITIYNDESPQGAILDEPYLSDDEITIGKKYLAPGKIVDVKEGEYIVIGDNRDESSDSREWGPITKRHIIGKAFFVYWPPEEVHLVKNALAEDKE